MREIEFWQNHLAKLHILLLTNLQHKKNPQQLKEIKRRIVYAEYELSISLYEQEEK